MHAERPRPLEVRLTLPVRTYDIDFAGIVNNIVFVRWLEDLRLAMLDVHLPINEQIAAGFAPAILKTEIHYRRALTLQDEVNGRIWVERMRRVRYTLRAEITSGDTLVATARQQGCFVAIKTKRPIAIPKQLVESFKSWPR